MKNHIFIIDDEPDTVAAGAIVLKENGYGVLTTTDPKEGLRRIQKSPPDLLLLDIQMPEIDGFEVCRKLKANPDTKHIPIIMLSVQSQESNVILGLGLGADDYIRKPFQEHELLARVKAVLRRNDAKTEEKTLTMGPLHINLDTYTATIDGKALTLEPKEFQILAFFARHEGRVVTRATISEHVWGTEFLPSSRTIDVRITHLRRKLGPFGSWIKSLRGIGYRFESAE
jgi:DNA-binding response OmpR family regulator